MINNTSKLIISVKQITESFYRSDMEVGPGWFNHMLFSPDSKRIAFFHRWRLYREDNSPWHLTHMFTANIDGSEISAINQDISLLKDKMDINEKIEKVKQLNDKYETLHENVEKEYKTKLLCLY